MISSYLRAARDAYVELAETPGYLPLFEAMAGELCSLFDADGKVLFAGNGGSAADCQHMAGEFVVRFRTDRQALPAIALTVDTSVLTACLNDYGAQFVFSRQVEALGRPGDVFWAYSTSGNSENILVACEAARSRGMKIFGFTSRGGGRLAELCDYCFRAPSDITSHVQECHAAVGHLLCHVVEQHFVAKR